MTEDRVQRPPEYGELLNPDTALEMRLIDLIEMLGKHGRPCMSVHLSTENPDGGDVAPLITVAVAIGDESTALHAIYDEWRRRVEGTDED